MFGGLIPKKALTTEDVIRNIHSQIFLYWYVKRMFVEHISKLVASVENTQVQAKIV